MSVAAPATKPRDYSRHVGVAFVFLIALLLLLALVRSFGDQLEPRTHVKIASDILYIRTQLKLYQSLNGFLPTTAQGLRALVEQPDDSPRPHRWYQLFTKLPIDPWGNHYVYRRPGTKNPRSFDLFSPGRDHVAYTADDDWGE